MSSPRPILHVTERLSSRGGADWHLLGVLAHQTRDPRLSIHLAVGREDGSASAPCAYDVLPGLVGPEAADVLGELHRRLRPALVHLHNVVDPAILRWAAPRPALVTVQDHRFFCPGRGKLTADDERCPGPLAPTRCAPCFVDNETRERRWSLTSARLDALRRLRVVVLSDYMRGELVAAGLDPARVHVVPPFVHALPPAPKTARDCVLVTGRLVHAKGVLEAAEAHRRAGLDIPLVFAGTGSLRNRLEAEGHQVTGWLSHDELVGWYARARALVFAPRWQEPFGIAGLEAMHYGTPVVAWESGGIAEWHPGTPPLAPWGDIDALAARLRQAIEEPVVWKDPYEPAPLMARLDDVYAEARA